MAAAARLGPLQLAPGCNPGPAKEQLHALPHTRGRCVVRAVTSRCRPTACGGATSRQGTATRPLASSSAFISAATTPLPRPARHPPSPPPCATTALGRLSRSSPLISPDLGRRSRRYARRHSERHGRRRLRTPAAHDPCPCRCSRTHSRFSTQLHAMPAARNRSFAYHPMAGGGAPRNRHAAAQ